MKHKARLPVMPKAQDANAQQFNQNGFPILAKTTPTAVAARYDRRVGRVVIALSNRLEVGFKPHDVQGLETARPAQLADIEISPSGLGLHFPQLDADLYLPALLQGFLGSRQWMAQAMGKVGGKAITQQST